jgi:hypothetical protein
MSLRELLSKNTDFNFRFGGLNREARPARSDVVMERTVALPTPAPATEKTGINICAATEKVATAEKEMTALKTEPTKAMGRKAAVEAKKDMKKLKPVQRSEKPTPVEILIKDLSAAKKAKGSAKESAKESVKELISSK